MVGRWSAGERRWFCPNWPEILYELFPEPFDPEDGEPGRRRIDEDNGHRPIYMPDSSALFKLVIDEEQSGALRRFVAAARLSSSELAIAEVRVSVRREARKRRDLDLQAALARVKQLLDEISLAQVDRDILALAGTRFDPRLRSLDAIHAATALRIPSLWAFITYDERQAAAAREVGLAVVSPGMKS